METGEGAGWPPDKNQPTDNVITFADGRSIPSPVSFVTINSTSETDVEISQQGCSSLGNKTTKRKKHSKKHHKKSRDEQSQDSFIPLGQTMSSQIQNNPDTQLTESCASPSATLSQTPSIPPYVPSGRQAYKSTDSGPFVVHVQKIETSLTSGTYLHPVDFGRFLEKNQIHSVLDGSVQRIGRNRISLTFTDFYSANNFVTSDVVKNNGFKAFIPSFGTTRLGLVKGIPVDWSEDEIMECIRVPIDGCPILKVRRLNYKVVVNGVPIFKPSQSCVITFDGQVLPSRVFMCFNSLVVERYYYPTVQCFSCARFGHTKNSCRSKPRCYKCGEGHTGDSCDVEEGSSPCLSCSGLHYSTNKTCPEFHRQKQIKITMAEKNISYNEAAKLHLPIRGKSYSDAAKTSYASVSSAPMSSTNKTPNSGLSSSQSYRKTVFLKPRPPPIQRQGYDRSAHQAIISNPAMPNNNGVAYKRPYTEPSASPSSILELIQALTRLLNSPSLLPSNAAQDYAAPMLQSLHDGALSRAAMELSKS